MCITGTYMCITEERKLDNLNKIMITLPRLKAAQTPDRARAKTISCAATISIILDLFFRKGSVMAQCSLGS